MRILSFGAGAIGTYIGGSLALQGHQVVFVERAEIAAGLKQTGLRLELDGEIQLLREPIVFASLQEALALGEYDLAIFALKSYDTETILPTLTPYANELPPLLCLQNGVENEAILEAALGTGKVIPGTVTSAIGRRGPGDIILERKRGVGVALGHPMSTRIAQLFAEAGLNARVFPKATDMKWSKMFVNLPVNASSAILNMRPDEVFASTELVHMEVAQLREALAVMKALEINVIDLPGTPVRLLALALHGLPTGLMRPFLQKGIGGGRGSKMPSFYIDLHSGRGKSEVSYLNGAIVRFGESVKIPTPVNRLLTTTLLALSDGGIPLDTFNHRPGKLLKMLSNSQTSLTL